MQKYVLIFILFLSFQRNNAQTWIDSLDIYAREKYMTPAKFHWNWMNASLLYTMVKQYDNGNESEKKIYFDYIKKSMDKSCNYANGKTPNAVASGLGMAFLLRVTNDTKYKKVCDKIFTEYLKIKRTEKGGVSHLRKDLEFWDDTIFMIGQFLLEMYKATNDEKYLDELVLQISLHREKLQDAKSGLWVHGWDSDNKSHCTFCGQLNWPDKMTGKSGEIWGRGNGWVVVTLSDALEIIPRTNKKWDSLTLFLKEMIVHLPELQNKQNGHWYQLPLKNNESKNFIESSSTAMFAYGISKAIKLGLVTDTIFNNSIKLAYNGLRNYSIKQKNKKYITTKNVCKGTCIGNETYYLKRKVKNEKPYSIGMFINFGREYRKLNSNYVPK
jgi:unsaturated rhamnogalacturonyl hydrolase